MTRTPKPDRELSPKQTTSSSSQAAGGPGHDAAVDADEVFSKVLRLIRAVQNGMQNIDRSHGLSGSQLWAIWQISAQPGQRVSDLAEALHIHPSTASNLLDKLEARGFVRRERRDTDNRVVRLFLGEDGLNLIKAIPGPTQGLLRHALQQVPAEILAGLHEGVTTVLDLMEQSPPQEAG